MRSKISSGVIVEKVMRVIELPFDEDKPQVGTSSLVDIAFLLLIFFVVSTTILPREGDLPMGVPPLGEAPLSAVSPIGISIRTDGSVWWGDESSAMQVAEGSAGRELPRLREMLASAVAGLGVDGTVVMLDVADQVGHQRFIDVLNAMSAEGVVRVMMR